jgi:hypothetical protein
MPKPIVPLSSARKLDEFIELTPSPSSARSRAAAPALAPGSPIGKVSGVWTPSLRIIVRAESRMANELDAAQDRGGHRAAAHRACHATALRLGIAARLRKGQPSWANDCLMADPPKLAGLYEDIYSLDVRPSPRRAIGTDSYRHSPDPACPCHDCRRIRELNAPKRRPNLFRRLLTFFSTARDVGRFSRLVKELSTIPNTADEMCSAMMDEIHGKRRSKDIALEEFTALMAPREKIAAVLAEHGYPAGAAAQAKLAEVYWLLLRRAGIRAGRHFIPTAALYDPGLLETVLKAESAGPQFVARATFDYFEQAGARSGRA